MSILKVIMSILKVIVSILKVIMSILFKCLMAAASILLSHDISILLSHGS